MKSTLKFLWLKSTNLHICNSITYDFIKIQDMNPNLLIKDWSYEIKSKIYNIYTLIPNSEIKSIIYHWNSIKIEIYNMAKLTLEIHWLQMVSNPLHMVCNQITWFKHRYTSVQLFLRMARLPSFSIEQPQLYCPTDCHENNLTDPRSNPAVKRFMRLHSWLYSDLKSKGLCKLELWQNIRHNHQTIEHYISFLLVILIKLSALLELSTAYIELWHC